MWYSDHQNADGTIYDLTGYGSSSETPTYNYDSADAYAALFTQWVWLHWKVSDDDKLGHFYTNVLDAANVILSLQQSDGQTYIG